MTRTLGQARPFRLDIPPGFIQLPGGDLDDAVLDRVAGQLATTINAPEVTDGIRTAAYSLAALMPRALTDAVPYVGLGLFRSPEAGRPVLMSLSCLSQPSNHDSVPTAVAGLLEIHRQHGRAREIPLPGGPAVISLGEQSAELTIGDAAPLRLLRREITAWVPDPAGRAIGVVSVSSNNWQDWEYVCEFLLGLCETLEWAW